MKIFQNFIKLKYCYIRKHLNPVNKHGERVSKIDKNIANKLEEEL